MDMPGENSEASLMQMTAGAHTNTYLIWKGRFKKYLASDRNHFSIIMNEHQ